MISNKNDLLIKTEVFGPKQVLTLPLHSYIKQPEDCLSHQNPDIDTLISTQLTLLTPIQQKQENQNKKKTKQVRFNRNVVTCRFMQNDPPLALGYDVKQFIKESVCFNWLNSNFEQSNICS